MTEEKARQSELYLVGIVCYYGRHYSTFFFQTRIRRWMYFDDAHVKEVALISEIRFDHKIIFTETSDKKITIPKCSDFYCQQTTL